MDPAEITLRHSGTFQTLDPAVVLVLIAETLLPPGQQVLAEIKEAVPADLQADKLISKLPYNAYAADKVELSLLTTDPADNSTLR